MIRIAIIGGGAAGLMVAATLVEKLDNQADIHLFEKNAQLGNKIRISGGGRCNITTGYYKKQDLQSKYIRGWDFLSFAIGQFGPRKMQQRCTDNNCSLYCQDDMRCFPASNKGSDVVAMFEKILHKGGVQIHFSESVKTIVRNSLSDEETPITTSNSEQNHDRGKYKILDDNSTNSQPSKELFTLTTNKDTYEFDFVVITSGGNAHGETGSTGDGYEFAKALGHTVTQLGPSLNSFLIQEERLKECSGISFSDGSLAFPSVYDGADSQRTATSTISGPILFTHFGISGPATFALSAHIPYEDITTNNPKTIYCKPFAKRGYDWWMNFFSIKTQEEPRRHLGKILEEHFARRRVDLFLASDLFEKNGNKISLEHIDQNTDNNQYKRADIQLANFSTEQKKRLYHLLGNGFPITLLARRPGDEFVTAGGVNTNEINPKTMESLLCPGLYFAGEILNIDAVTGGFNFQSARSTGRCAGESIGEFLMLTKK